MFHTEDIFFVLSWNSKAGASEYLGSFWLIMNKWNYGQFHKNNRAQRVIISTSFLIVQCLTSVLRSIHSSGKSIRCTTWTDNMLWPGGIIDWVVYYWWDLPSVGQHELRIMELNKSNTCPSAMRSVSYISCR